MARPTRGQPLAISTVDAEFSTNAVDLTPILRGARRTERYSYAKDRSGGTFGEVIATEIRESGVVTITMKTANENPLGVSTRWILGEVANVLRVVARVRRLAGVPDAEYAMEIDIRIDDHHTPNTTAMPAETTFGLGLLNEEIRHSAEVFRSLTLPRYAVGDESMFSEVLKTVLRDLYNAIGRVCDDVSFDALDECQPALATRRP
jgi:hypothetical protein